MAAQNEASIRASTAPKVARNTPRSRCSSALHQRPSNLSASASASLIASRASEERCAKCKASALSARNSGTISVEPVARVSSIPSSINEMPSAVSPEALRAQPRRTSPPGSQRRSEEHTSELQSRQYLVCRLLLEKKKKDT